MRASIKKHLLAKGSPSLKILLTDLDVKSFVCENQRHSFNGWVTLLGPISKFCGLSLKGTGSRFSACSLRWLDWIFWGEYLPRLSINCVGMSKDMGKRLPQLYYIMMKLSYDLRFIAIGVAMAT